MALHHEFSGDQRLPSATRRLLQGYEGGYHRDIHATLRQASAGCNLAVGSPTLERWFRMITWAGYADHLSDSPVSGFPSRGVCEEAIRALEPPAWRPTIAPFDKKSLAAYHWSRIARSSFEDGDVHDDRRVRLAGVAHTLCHIGREKMHSLTLRDYTATCRAEGMLIGDLFAGCLSDDEWQAPEAEGFTQFLRQAFKANIVMDSAVDYGEDKKAGRLLLSGIVFPRLYLATHAVAELGSLMVSAPSVALRAHAV